MIALILATSMTFTIPTVSADRNCRQIAHAPAGVRKVRAWALTTNPASPYWNRYRLVWALNYRRPVDGRAMRLTIADHYAPPGDSVLFRVAVADSAGNWACRDAEISRRMP